MPITKLISSAEIHLSAVLNEAGSILYSSPDTLTQSDIYIVGFNPGGTGGPTIAQHLKNLPQKSENAYIDESWSNQTTIYLQGKAPLQKRLQWLASDLGYDLSRICASNLIFIKSRNAQGVRFPDDADLCWPVHRNIISSIRPKLLLTFGNSNISPYGYLLNRLKGKEESISSGHGNWKCRGFATTVDQQNLYVAGLPHLSRYCPIGKAEVVEWLKSKLQA